jgi:hypothetical protein
MDSASRAREGARVRPVLALLLVLALPAAAAAQTPEALAEARAAARERLVAVAGAVTEHEASEDPAYAVLLDRYAQAEALIDVPEPTPERLARAAPLLDEAERAIAQLVRPAGPAATPAAPA